MPIYLKKAFSFGPFRLNLSKSGLGLSFGVTGLRIGTGPKGPYFHAGRGGLYFRKSLNDFQNNQAEIIEETPEATEPLPIWKKIFALGANFIVASFIIMLVITIVFIYFSIDFIKFASKTSRKPKINRKSKNRKR